MWSEHATQWLHYFENKIGIPITPYKKRMIDGSESPNASWSFDSEIVHVC